MLKKINSFLILLTALLCFGTANAWGETLHLGSNGSALVGCPVYATQADRMYCSQTVYPAASLAAMTNKSITHLAYFLRALNPNGDYSSVQIRLLEVDYDVLATSTGSKSFKSIEGATLVFEGTLPASTTTELEVEFSEPFAYSGGNLLIDVRKTVTGGSYAPSSSSGGKGRFQGTSVSTYVGLYAYGSTFPTTGTPLTYYPDITFTYEDGTPITCPKPSALTQGEVSHNSAAFSWKAGGSETTWQYVYLPAATDLTDEAWEGATAGSVNSASVSLNGLSAATDYKLYVRAYCSSEDQSNPISIQFRTNNAVPFSEDFTGLTSGSIPSGWDNSEGTTTTANYKWVYYSGGHDAAPCVRFNSYNNGSGKTNVLKTPAIYVDKSAALSFWYKNPTGGDFSVYYSIDGVKQADALATGLTGAADWTNYEVVLPAACVGHKVMILFQATSNYGSGDAYIYLDDVVIEAASSCVKPTVLNAYATSATTANVSWIAGGEETAWNLQFSTDNFETYTERNGITENPYTLTGLSAQTTYKVHIQADCGGAQSGWVASSAFTTPCAAVDGIGWSENFDDATAGSGKIPDCWQKISNNNGDLQVSATGYYQKVEDEGKCLYFYGGVTSTPRVAILPPFSEATNTLYVTLDYSQAYEAWGYPYDYSSEGYGQLSIGYITNPADASSFVAVETLPRVSEYTTASVALTNAPAGSYVALRYAGGESSGYLFVDNISISAIPSCVAPSGVAGSASAYNQASISWKANGSESAWKIHYSSDNGENWSDEITANTNPFTLTGLSANTDYIVQVKALCGELESSSWSGSSAPIHTPCGAVDASDYNVNFENSAAGIGKLPDCWQYKEKYSTGYPYVYNGSSYAYASDKCLYFQGGVDESSEQSVLLPEMDQPLNGLTFEFYYKDAESGWYTYAKFTVGYIAADGTTFVPVETLNYADNYTKYTKDLSSVPSNAKCLAIRFAGGESTAYGYIDNVRVYPTPTCAAPTGVTVSDVTATTAQVAWTENNSATAWKLQISNDGTNWTDVNGGAEITANPYTLTGLTPNQTTYYARVKTICSASDESPWSEASAPFQTECETRSMPFPENFNSLTEGIPTCWDNAEGTTTTDSYKWKYYATGHDGAGVQFDSYNNSNGNTNVLKTPSIAISEAAMLDFWYMNAAGGDLSVYYSIDGVKQAEPLAFGLTDKSEWTQVSVNLPNTCVGHDVVIMFQGTSNYGYSNIYLDDVQVIEQPACPAVNSTTLAASAVTANSATVAWTAANEETAWNLQYKADGGEWSEAIAVSTTPSYDFTGLAANTLYYVKVQADCGGDQSEWTGDEAFSFRTDCDPKTVSKASPWNYGFEDTNDGFMPLCWERTEPYANYGYPVVAEYSYYAQNGDKYLYLKTPGRNGGTAYTEDAILPVFNTEIKNLKVSFSYFNSGTTSNYGQLAIGYVVGDAFTQVGELLAQVEDYTLMEREMPNDAPDGARIAIRCVGSTKGSSYTTTAYLDDIQVSLKPTCYTPTNLQAVATSNGASLSWMAGKDEAAWQVRYKATAADDWTMVDAEVASPAYNLTGLTVDVEYEAQVRAYCDELDQSEWSASAEFEPVCNAPSALTVTARTQNSASFSWTSSENAWVLQYSTDGENWESENVAANPFTLEGLAAGQAYQAKIQSACGSDFSNVVEFTTWCDSKLSLPVELTSFSAIPACWEESPAGAVSFANNKLCFVGEGEKFIYLPQTDVNLNLLSATFTFSGSLEFGYIDAPNGAFQAFETQPTSGVELNLENEAAAVKYIAIRYNGASNLSQASISAISIRKTPTCAKLDAPTATPGVGSAEISWTAGSEEAWNLQYKLASAADWTTVAVSENPYALNGLEQGVSYKVRVQANCGEELSDWSDEATFITNCASIDALPYYADFSVALSSCWAVFAQDESYYKPYANTAMNQLVMNGGKDGASNNVVIMPPFAADLANAVISLEYSCSTGANYAQLEVGYVTDKADAATFSALETLAQSSSWVEARVATATVPENAYIAFRYAGGNSHGDLAIRNLRVINQLVLADNVNNSAALAANEGQTVDVQIGRTIICADYFNTICLPFDLPTLAGTPLEGGELWAFKYAKVDEATDELLFRIIESDHIEAGVPYFISFPAGDNIVSPIFKNVTIAATAGQKVGSGDVAQLCGIIDQPVVFEPNDQTKLFLAANNTLYWWAGTANSQLNNFRAYFKVNTNSGANNAPRHGMRARIIKNELEEQVATGMENVQGENQSLKLLENGQVVIIRNGKKYNAAGQLVK